jgi:cell division transport system ATP-binding protein
MIDENEKSLIIRMFHVLKQYGVKKALIDINLDVFKNEFLFITGPSGAGKSTLLKLLYFGEPVSEGQILIDGMNLS